MRTSRADSPETEAVEVLPRFVYFLVMPSLEGVILVAQQSAQLVKLYQIELDAHGQPIPESVRQAARNTALVRIHLAESVP